MEDRDDNVLATGVSRASDGYVVWSTSNNIYYHPDSDGTVYIMETGTPTGYSQIATGWIYFTPVSGSTSLNKTGTGYAVSTSGGIITVTVQNQQDATPTPAPTPTTAPTPTPTPSYDYDIRVQKKNADGTASLAGAVFEIRTASGTVLATGTTSRSTGYAYWDTNNTIWFKTTDYQGQKLYIYEVTPPTGYEISLTAPILIRPGYDPESTSGTGYTITRNATRDYLITVSDDLAKQEPSISTVLTGENGTKEPIANHSVALTDTVTISDLDSYQNQTLRVEGHLHVISPSGTTEEIASRGTVVYVDSLTEQVSLTYTIDAWELRGRTLVAFVELYDSSNELITSHTDINDESQQVTFCETGKATFYKHGEQFTDTTISSNGTVTFRYEDIGLSGVEFQVVAAENVVKADGTTVYTAGTVVRNNLSPEADGTLTLEDLPYGKYKLVEVETDGKHTAAADTEFEVNAYSGGTQEVDHDIPNTRKTVRVQIEKVDSADTSKPIAGARYGLYAAEDVVNCYGETEIERGALVAYAVTDDTGAAAFVTINDTPVDLPVGFRWTVKELYVPVGYRLDETEYTVSFTDTDSTTESIVRYVDSDGDNKVTDEQQPGSILLIKKDAKGHTLAGTTYRLEYATSENGPWFSIAPYASADSGVLKGKALGVNVNGEITTGSNGKAEFTGLLADGTIYYRVVEVSAPDGYQLLAEPIYVGTLPQTADSTINLANYDINGDEFVDDADLSVLDRAISGSVTLASGKGDINGDGTVNSSDRQLMSDFLTQYHKQNVSTGDTPFNRRYILDYFVTNGEVFELPHTGSSDFRWIWMAFAFAGMLMSGSLVIISAVRRRELNR